MSIFINLFKETALSSNMQRRLIEWLTNNYPKIIWGKNPNLLSVPSGHSRKTYSHLTSSLDRSEWSTARSLLDRRLGGPMGLSGLRRTKSLAPDQNRTTVPRTFSLLNSLFTIYALLVPTFRYYPGISHMAWVESPTSSLRILHLLARTETWPRIGPWLSVLQTVNKRECLL